jgi:hypothetical protein
MGGTFRWQEVEPLWKAILSQLQERLILLLWDVQDKQAWRTVEAQQEEQVQGVVASQESFQGPPQPTRSLLSQEQEVGLDLTEMV